jgi:hypothetical protein
MLGSWKSHPSPAAMTLGVINLKIAGSWKVITAGTYMSLLFQVTAGRTLTALCTHS